MRACALSIITAAAVVQAAAGEVHAQAIATVLDASGDGVHPLVLPREAVVDASGNVFVVGQMSQNVFRIAPGGAVS
ncbi:MAG: hypothetical protein ACKOCT_20205, partial [Alphaproteobacteria bacterium]